MAIFGETCPQYLTLTQECLCHPDGNKFLCSPPLRTVADQTALWAALRRDELQVASAAFSPTACAPTHLDALLSACA